jgi:hypothetical protein
LIGVCMLPLFAALPGLYPPLWKAAPAIESRTTLQDELAGFHFATLREGLLLPSSAPGLPSPLPRLLETLAEGAFTRAMHQGLSAGPWLTELEQGAVQSVFKLASNGNPTRPVEADIYLLNWLGWSAEVDRQPLPITSNPQGLMRVALPAAASDLIIRLGGTPARDASWGLTMLGLLLLAGIARRLRDLRRRTLVRIVVPSTQRGDLVALSIVAVLWAGLSMLINADPTLISANRTEREMTPLPHRWQGDLDLLGYQLTTAQGTPGGSLPLTLYWQAFQEVTVSYQSEVILTNANGQVMSATLHRHPGGVPTQRWALNEIMRDEYTLRLPAALPTGAYALWVRLGGCATPQLLPCGEPTLRALSATDGQGRVKDGAIMLPILISVRP